LANLLLHIIPPLYNSASIFFLASALGKNLFIPWLMTCQTHRAQYAFGKYFSMHAPLSDLYAFLIALSGGRRLAYTQISNIWP
jgi:hypothetical protein